MAFLDMGKFKSDICAATCTLMRYDKADNYVIDELLCSIREIGYRAFAGSNLVAVYIPENIETIEGEAFADCEWLNVIKFNPNCKIRVIEKGFAKNCPRLEEVRLGLLVTEVRDEAFMNCPKLNTIFYSYEGLALGKNVLKGSYPNVGYLIPRGNFQGNAAEMIAKSVSNHQIAEKQETTIKKDEEIEIYIPNKESPVAEARASAVQKMFGQGSDANEKDRKLNQKELDKHTNTKMNSRLIERMIIDLKQLISEAPNSDKSNDYKEYVKYLQDLDNIHNK